MCNVVLPPAHTHKHIITKKIKVITTFIFRVSEQKLLRVNSPYLYYIYTCMYIYTRIYCKGKILEYKID